MDANVTTWPESEPGISHPWPIVHGANQRSPSSLFPQIHYPFIDRDLNFRSIPRVRGAIVFSAPINSGGGGELLRLGNAPRHIIIIMQINAHNFATIYLPTNQPNGRMRSERPKTRQSLIVSRPARDEKGTETESPPWLIGD